MKTVYDLILGEILDKEVSYNNQKYIVKGISGKGKLILRDSFNSVQVPLEESKNLELVVKKHKSEKITEDILCPSDEEVQKFLDAQDKFYKK